MNFNDAKNDLDGGKLAWRAAWPDKSSFYRKTPVNSPYHGSLVDQNDKFVYDVSNEDRAATDWQTGISRAAQAIIESFKKVEVAPPPPPPPVVVEEPKKEEEEETEHHDV